MSNEEVENGRHGSPALQPGPTGFCIVLFHSRLGSAVTCQHVHSTEPHRTAHSAAVCISSTPLLRLWVSTGLTEITLPGSLVDLLLSRRVCSLAHILLAPRALGFCHWLDFRSSIELGDMVSVLLSTQLSELRMQNPLHM